MGDFEFRAQVRGLVRFPEHPTHEGHLGLEGGEDVRAERSTFRSVGEAMAWCESVLDDRVSPRSFEAYGDLLEPREGPFWSTAEVTVAYRWPWERAAPEDVVYQTSSGDQEWWDAQGGFPVRSRRSAS